MLPRTIHRKITLQMQIQEGKDFPNILFGNNQEEVMKSKSLQSGYEYEYELDPYGKLSTEDFKAMSLDNRNCRLDHEIFQKSTHSIYTKANCKYDCHVNLAFETCKCVPWDFVNKIQGGKECDIFGRTCFFNVLETLAHGFDQNCSHCIEECDSIKYRRTLIKETTLNLVKEEHFDKWGNNYYTYCNKYICIDPTLR